MAPAPRSLRRQRTQLAALGPLDQLRAGRLPLRLVWLLVGLFLYGASMAMVLRGSLGQIPWDVLHVGLGQNLPFSFGATVVLVSFTVLLAWIPLRQPPGLGTLGNALLIGPSADVVLAVLPSPEELVPRIALVVGGIVLNGVATAMYVGAQLGPGPRDGLMTGIARRTGWSCAWCGPGSRWRSSSSGRCSAAPSVWRPSSTPWPSAR